MGNWGAGQDRRLWFGFSERMMKKRERELLNYYFQDSTFQECPEDFPNDRKEKRVEIDGCSIKMELLDSTTAKRYGGAPVPYNNIYRGCLYVFFYNHKLAFVTAIVINN